MATVAANDRPQGMDISRNAIVSSQHRDQPRRGRYPANAFSIEACMQAELNFYFAQATVTVAQKIADRWAALLTSINDEDARKPKQSARSSPTQRVDVKAFSLSVAGVLLAIAAALP
jgi:hypothetical protein